MKQWLFKRRWRMVLAGLVITALPVLAITLYVYFEVAANIEQIVLSENRQTAENVAVHIEEAIDRDIAVGRLLASRPLLQDAVEKGNGLEINRHLRGFVDNVISVERTLITDSRGIVLADYPAVSGVVGSDLSGRDWYKGVSDRWEPYVSEFHLRTAEPKRYIFAIAVPVKADEDRPVGILIIHPKQNYIRDELRHITNRSGQKVFIVDSKGILVHRSDAEVETRIDLSAEAPVTKALNGESGAIRIKDAHGSYMLSFYNPVRAFGWGVVIQRPEEDVYGPLKRIAGGLAIFSVLMLFMAFGAATMMSNLTFSLKKLTDDLEQRVVERTDERTRVEQNLRQSEAFIQNILENVDEGFIVVDRDYRIISANRAYCRQLKTETCDIIGKQCHAVSHHLDRPCFFSGEECAPALTFRTGVPHVAIHTHHDSEGNPVYLETKSYPMRDEHGNIYAVIETLNNITEKRSLEEQLRHTQKMEAIGTLAGGIAHDFNNMLNVIMGYGGLMQMKMKPEDPLLDNLKEMIAAGERAAQLTKGLLTFSRKQVMEVRTVNINEIVEGFRKMITRIIGEDIELRIDLTPPLPGPEKGSSDSGLIVRADVVQIEQVLMNLAANARDAMPGGGTLGIGTVPFRIDRDFIRAHGYGEPGDYALLTVSDTGEGMDEITRGKIFEPFFTTKELGRGTGLGLSIVYGIVKQHKGFINCYSERGKGTTFRIYLPLVEDMEDQSDAKEKSLPAGGDETILIAEDDISVRGLMKQVLGDFGYRTIEAVDGDDAVRRFMENRDDIHLLLFDLIMPGKNGKTAYEEIAALRPDIKVLFISGYARDIVQSFDIKDGFDFISKPVSPNELLYKIREILDRK